MSEKSALDLDQELASRLTNERTHTIETILLIAEIDHRKTFVELGYSSAWDYLRRMHGQSDTMIHYRLTCARAIHRFPQVVEPLREGRLCMTTLAKLMEVMNETNCDALLAEALGKSKRDVKRIVAREKPQPIPKDVTRSLVPAQVIAIGALAEPAPLKAPAIASEEPVRTEILTESLSRKHITVDREYENLLEALRAALSHKMPKATEFEILKECMRRTLKDEEKRQGIVDKPRADQIGEDGKITQSVKRTVRKRDQGRCQWRSEDGGICGSTHRIQFHHIQDRGKGGEGTPDNVIQLCQKHNLLAAEIAWGQEHIDQFRKRPREQAPEDLQSQLDFTEPH